MSVVPILIIKLKKVWTFTFEHFTHSLIKSGANPLMAAADKGYLRIVEILTQKGALIDVKSMESIIRAYYVRVNSYIDCSALFYAAKNGHDQVVEHLLRVGASIDLANTNGIKYNISSINS